MRALSQCRNGSADTRRLFLILFIVCYPLWALDPSRRVDQYAHTAWPLSGGLIPDLPNSIAQTADGYLWIGTVAGLFHFDGVRFERWSEPSGRELATASISSLVAARDGSLWIGERDGQTSGDHHLYRWWNGKLTRQDMGNALLQTLFESRSGAISYPKNVGRDFPNAVCRIADGSTRCYELQELMPPGDLPESVAEDRDGILWVGGSQTLLRLQPDHAQVFHPKALRNSAGAGVMALVPALDGSLYAGMAVAGEGGGLQHIVGDRSEPIRTEGFDSSSLKVKTLLLDRQGALWVGTWGQGIYRITGGKVDHFTAAEGLSGNLIQAIYEDHEGNVWVGTWEGLDQFRDTAVASFTTKDGLCTVEADSLLATRDGTILVGGDNGLCTLRQGRFTSLLPTNKVPGYQVTALFEDHAGQLWVGIDHRLFIYESGKLSPIADVTPGLVGSITEDTEHNIWASVYAAVRSIIRIRDRKVVARFPAPALPATRKVAADPAGGIWLAGLDGDLARYRDGRIETFHYPRSTGTQINSMLVQPDGTVYAARSDGLIAWRNGKQQLLGTRNGLPCEEVYDLVPDVNGNFWLYMRCGLVEVSRADMERWWNQADTQVHFKLFGKLDGAWPLHPPFGSAARTSDGKLWFVNARDLQVVDPNDLPSNPLRPPVHVEALTADGKRYAAQGDLHLPARTRDLEVDYTALSFVVPQRVRFRYKLEGRDTDWVDAGTRRQAFYTDLRPRTYRFHVIACNNDGVWNEEGASLVFNVAAAWYQTLWFVLLVAMAAGLLLLVAFHLRMRRMAALLMARFNERLEERTRLARDFHDTLLQTIQGSKMVADNALKHNADLPQMRSTMAHLSEWLGRAVHEGRSALSALRGSISEGNELAEAFRRAGEEYRFKHPMEMTVVAEGQGEHMHPIVRDEVYRIGYEAIRNAFTHSGGGRVNVELSYAADLLLRVRDDGKGFDAGGGQKEKEGHFGMVGMHERAARIGAKLTISTAPTGTQVELRIPRSIVFQGSDAGGKSAFRRLRIFFTNMRHNPTDTK